MRWDMCISEMAHFSLSAILPQTILDHSSLATRSSEDFSRPGMGLNILPLCGTSTRTFFVASKLLRTDSDRHLQKITDAVLEIKPSISEVI